jgi:prepilin-type N-terminal cleavage/methylation domain-containing protein
MTQRLKNSEGFTLIESLLALGLVSIFMVAGGVKIKSVGQQLKSVDYQQTANLLESRTRDLASVYSTYATSIEKSSDKVVSDCASTPPKPCVSLSDAVVDLYLWGQSSPFTGSKVYYSEDGKQCKGTSPGTCGKFNIETRVIYVCSTASPCVGGVQPIIQIHIKDLTSAKVIRTSTVEVEVPRERVIPLQNYSCGSSEVIAGIAIDNTPICVKIEDMKKEYEDSLPETMIQATDCRISGKPKDSRYLKAIDSKGKGVCAPKTW